VRAAVAAEACREAHVRWHGAVAASPARARSPAPAPSSQLSVCVVGTDPDDLAATRDSVDAQSRASAEVLTIPEPAAASPSADLVLFTPAGSRLEPGAIETLERAAASGAEVIAVAVALTPERRARAVTRVPVGGPVTAGLLRRCFGDAAFVIRRTTLERLGGADPDTEPPMQAHQLLCRAAISGVAIEVLPEPLVTDLPPGALGPMTIAEPTRTHPRLVEAYRRAPGSVLAELPLLAQQLWATASAREAEWVHLYENRFGRLTLPIRRTVNRARRVRRAFQR